MHLEYTPEQHRLRTELRSYFAELVPDNAYARHADPAVQKRFYRETVRRLQDGACRGRGVRAVAFDHGSGTSFPASRDGP